MGRGRQRGRRNPQKMWGWIIGIAFIGLILFNLVLWRDTLMDMVPGARGVYAAIGLAEPAAAGGPNAPITDLRIAYPRPAPPFQRDNQWVQGITGTITNPTGQPKTVPPLRGKLLNDNREVVHEWSFRAPLPEIGAGQTMTFDTEIIGLPASARSMVIEFDSGARAR
jgi:hypothetical protein